MTDANSGSRLVLKSDLLQQIQRLDWQQALLPPDDPAIAATVQRLEAMTPISQPLHPDNWPALLGTWQLLYASRGTVVTRQLAEPAASRLPPVGIKQIWQTLSTKQTTLMTENGADLVIPWLGLWRLKVEGTWIPVDKQNVSVMFQALTVQSRLTGSGWTLPELRLPVLEFLSREALWITSYLDEDLRVGRGATGNLFVFQRHV